MGNEHSSDFVKTMIKALNVVAKINQRFLCRFSSFVFAIYCMACAVIHFPSFVRPRVGEEFAFSKDCGKQSAHDSCHCSPAFSQGGYWGAVPAVHSAGLVFFRGASAGAARVWLMEVRVVVAASNHS